MQPTLASGANLRSELLLVKYDRSRVTDEVIYCAIERQNSVIERGNDPIHIDASKTATLLPCGRAMSGQRARCCEAVVQRSSERCSSESCAPLQLCARVHQWQIVGAGRVPAELAIG